MHAIRRESRETAAAKVEDCRHKGERKDETDVEGHVVDSVDRKSGRDNELEKKAN